MKRYLFGMLIPLLFLTLALLPSEQVGAQPRQLSPNLSALELIEKANSLRQAQGLVPYKQNQILMTLAQDHVEYIASTGVLTHFDDKGRRPYERAMAAGYSVAGNLSAGGSFAEAIFSGSAVSDDEVLSAWQANTADSAALFSADFEDVGVGITAANGITYYVLVAGTEGEARTAVPSVAASLLTPLTGTVYPNTALPDGAIFHDVRKNEALWSIAVLYDTTIEELKLLNGLATDEIFAGQRLVIRPAWTETPTPSLVPVTATLGIPTSTATKPVTPTITQTPTALPAPPTTLRSGGLAVGAITLAALSAAGLFSFLGKRKEKMTNQDRPASTDIP